MIKERIELKNEAKSAMIDEPMKQQIETRIKQKLLKYLRKTAEKRRVDSDFDKEFREREAARKREWRKDSKSKWLRNSLRTRDWNR